MVTPLHRLILISGSLLCTLALCQCESTQTVTTRTQFSFDEKLWGGQGGNDSAEIRNKFTNKGYTIAEDGSIKADKADLYRDKKPRGFDSEFGTKKARFKKMEADTKIFKTPEYLKRQEFAGVKSADESGSRADESDFGKSRDKAAGKLFNKKSQNSTALAAYKTNSAEEVGSIFATKKNSEGSAAIDSAPRATGISQGKMGYKANAALTVDDVKKMLNPGSYADARNLD